MKIKATVNNQELELDIDEQSLVKAGYVKAKKEHKRWRGEDTESYYFTTPASDNPIESCDELNDDWDNFRYETGNYYQTEELAQAALDRQLALVRVNDRILELNEGWEPEKENSGAVKWLIGCERHRGRLLLSAGQWFSFDLGTKIDCIKNKYVAEQIISECKDDLKVIFGV